MFLFWFLILFFLHRPPCRAGMFVCACMHAHDMRFRACCACIWGHMMISAVFCLALCGVWGFIMIIIITIMGFIGPFVCNNIYVLLGMKRLLSLGWCLPWSCFSALLTLPFLSSSPRPIVFCAACKSCAGLVFVLFVRGSVIWYTHNTQDARDNMQSAAGCFMPYYILLFASMVFIFIGLIMSLRRSSTGPASLF